MTPLPRIAICVATALLATALVPRAIAARDADALFDGDLDAQHALAREVVAYVERAPGASSFHTGSPRFDGEWAFGTSQMAVLGLGQIVLEHPEMRDAYLPAMRAAAQRMIERETLRFAIDAWEEDPIAALRRSERALRGGHAYLGYAGLALGMLRQVDPETPLAPLHDAMNAALARRLERAPHALFETYPGESYPVDVLAAAASVALHARITGVDRSAMLARWGETFRARWVDRPGYLVQSARAGRARDAPRASGTALGAYFASFVDAELSRTLYRGLASEGHVELLGFGAIREYAPGFEGTGDIDSGPVVLGTSVSGTGFALAGARIHGDRETYRSLYRTAWLFGVPVAHGEGRRFLAGGPLGNAILLAMLTARAAS